MSPHRSMAHRLSDEAIPPRQRPEPIHFGIRDGLQLLAEFAVALLIFAAPYAAIVYLATRP